MIPLAFLYFVNYNKSNSTGAAMNKPSVWTNQHCDVQIAYSAPNDGYWRVFTGTHQECLDFVRNEA
jgi:hypothetical protein